MYIIEEIWFDGLENTFSNAVGYSTIGYVDAMEEVEQIISSGKTYTKENCWAISKPMSQFRFRKIERLDLDKYKQ